MATHLAALGSALGLGFDPFFGGGIVAGVVTRGVKMQRVGEWTSGEE
jgi:hypothetical protein